MNMYKKRQKGQYRSGGKGRQDLNKEMVLRHVAKSKNLGGRYTVAIWTQKPFTPLLTRLQGCQGCLKMPKDLLNMEYEVWCAKIAQKRHKLQKTSKLNKKCQKTPVFLDIFEYSSIWGQS